MVCLGLFWRLLFCAFFVPFFFGEERNRKTPALSSRKLKMPLASLKPFNAASLDGVFSVFFGSPLKGFFTLRKCHFLNAFGANAR
jgi:hypothetical protein